MGMERDNVFGEVPRCALDIELDAPVEPPVAPVVPATVTVIPIIPISADPGVACTIIVSDENGPTITLVY